MAADSTYAHIHRRMVESGEWDRIFAALVARLNEIGWMDEFKLSAKEQARNMSTTRFKDLLTELEDQGHSSVPLAVKKEITNMIKTFVEKQVD
ncbi:transcription factor e(y)2-domain-containing protein [Phellopilus nigrolimitatus]|nr:transcription factor e(y)2-domain-containing protein [Phellopilus nigrolimitatus]